MTTDAGSPTSKDGENIIATLSQTRRFLGEVAKLLQTGDASMRDGSWSTKANQAVTVSKGLDEADSWIPCLAFRFYENEDHKHLLPFIAVLFDYDDEEIKLKTLQEPLLTAGWHDYSSGGKLQDYSFYCAAVHVYIQQWEANGKWKNSDPRTTFPESWTNTRTAAAPKCRSFALPLMSFASAEGLIQRVVDPLLKDIKSFSGKPK